MSIFFTTVALITSLLGTPMNAKSLAPEVPHEPTLQVKEADRLDIYIELLAFEESSGREDIDIVDTNGKHSRGCPQFQDATLQSHARKYDLFGDPLDCRYQKTLARQILLRGGWRNWFNSVTRLNQRAMPVPVLDL
jgi:hypothetical protein